METIPHECEWKTSLNVAEHKRNNKQKREKRLERWRDANDDSQCSAVQWSYSGDGSNRDSDECVSCYGGVNGWARVVLGWLGFWLWAGATHCIQSTTIGYTRPANLVFACGARPQR